MMSTPLSKIKQWLKHVRAVPMNSHQYWMLLLRIFFGAFACLIILSFYLLYQLKTEQIFQIKRTSDGTNTINQALLQNVTASLNQKAQTQRALQASPTTYPDPGQ